MWIFFIYPSPPSFPPEMRVTSLSAGMLDIRADEGNKQAVTFADSDFLFSVGRSARNVLNVFFFFLFFVQAPSREPEKHSYRFVLSDAREQAFDKTEKHRRYSLKVKEQIKN